MVIIIVVTSSEKQLKFKLSFKINRARYTNNELYYFCQKKNSLLNIEKYRLYFFHFTSFLFKRCHQSSL